MPSPTNAPVKFLPLGAIIQEFWIGGQNIVLGFPHQQDYQVLDHPYFGETIGRFPNRLSDGKIANLNGRDYTFIRNERGITTLHGGSHGWGKKIWDGPQRARRGERDALLFTLQSPDGDEGFPGKVEARVWYAVCRKTREDNCDCRGAEEVTLDVEYEIEMTGDEADITETVCAMTNHGYWNLSGEPTVAGTQVEFATDLHLGVDENQIPTGKMSPHPAAGKGHAVPFTETSPAIDDCFVLDPIVQDVPIDTRNRPLRRYVSMFHAGTGIHLAASTTEPSFQFYSGDGISVAGMGSRSGIALEPNRYVNAANRPEWRSLVLLRRGQAWGCRNQFRAWCD